MARSELTFDYVIVGGGSAGCVVAAELSADPSVRVLVLEHGDDARAHPETLHADGYKDAFINDSLIHERFSSHEARWGSRRLFMGSGRGLGGSGSINGMVYTRGSRLDYEEWPSAWRWERLVPHFEAIERTLRVRPRPATTFSEICVDAAEAVGFRRSADLNDGDLSRVLGYETMSYEGDDRRSSYVAFLAPVLDRPNLTVITNASVERLLVTEDGVRGALFVQDGARQTAKATREVIMTAGALETPRILMLSGIGPGQALRRVGLPAIFDVPGVGQNLHDHPNVCVFYRGTGEVDFKYPMLYGFDRANETSALPQGMSDTCYVFYPARSSLKEMMMRIVPALVLPPTLYEQEPLKRGIRGAIGGLFSVPQVTRFVEGVYGIVVILGKPKSRGALTLEAADPRTPARIDPGYFADPEDMDTMVHGIARARQIAGAAPLAAFGNQELSPGPFGGSREALERWVRLNVMTTYHYAGTCAMGEDEASVTDPELKVRGVPGLRIADASAVPVTPVSAMNAPSMLVGHRAAQLVLEEHHGRSSTSSRSRSAAGGRALEG
ncbi:MAG: GMC family oxidoreductase [Sandaracinaceae bacterium]